MSARQRKKKVFEESEGNSVFNQNDYKSGQASMKAKSTTKTGADTQVRQQKVKELSSCNNGDSDHHYMKKEVKTTGGVSDCKFKALLGFNLADFSSFQNFVELCNKPTDAACLAVFRILFGTLMVCDSMHERGLPSAVHIWSDDFELCRFPLLTFLKPLPVEWMVILYLIMASGAACIALGLFYRVACLSFVLPYWYMFLLDKRSWNNHSYLFGLIATLLLFCDANVCWSLDSLRGKSKRKDIPTWQYGLFRFQLVVVYFIAGLKKLDQDWVQGYSMQALGGQWVFDPFRYILTDDQIDKYIVHWGGLAVDLTAGFLLYFDPTRYIGSAIVVSFNAMNSRIFRIGQFPYVMLSSVVLFYPYDWPKKMFPSHWFNSGPTVKSSHCLYPNDPTSKARFYHKFFAVFTVSVMVWQSFMPYSHFITRGYNNWTGGLYGYSWDMMVHNWRTQHVKIKYVSETTGEEGYLDPKAFVGLNRWTGYPDMMKQHAVCIADHLATDFGIPDAKIYMDIWHSMNKRFNQRIIDPNVDLVSVDWSPFKPASFLLPLLNDLEGWRTKLGNISQEARQQSVDWLLERADTTFVADFPGMYLENYLGEDLGRTNITLLAGSAVLYQPEEKKNVTLEINKPVHVGIGTHMVYVTSDIPACYMYLYSNTTQNTLDSQLSQLEAEIIEDQVDQSQLEQQAEKNETLKRLLQLKHEKEKQQEKTQVEKGEPVSFWEINYKRVSDTYAIAHHCYLVSSTAIESLFTGASMVDLMEKKLNIPEDD